jgi:ribonuclease D
MIEATLVTDAGHLDSAVARLRTASRLAIDTEFMRERTYFPQLCLIQVASDSDCYLIDPLAGLSLEPLFALLTDRGKLMILHAARQDLGVLLQTDPRGDRGSSAKVRPIPARIGQLRRRSVTGTHRATARQLIDKDRRAELGAAPLQSSSPRSRRRSLLELHATSARSRLVAERPRRTRAIERVSLYRTVPTHGGTKKVWAPAPRAAGREVAQWREERAIASDRPRGWILPDEALFAIATQLPATLDSLESVRSVPPGTVRRHGEELLARVRNAQAQPTDDEPARSGRPDPEVVALAARLMQVIRDEASRLEISPELLATRRDIDALAQGEASSSLLTGWRGQVVGEALRTVLSRRAASESA